MTILGLQRETLEEIRAIRKDQKDTLEEIKALRKDQREIVEEIKALRQDLVVLLDERLRKMEEDVARMKAKLNII